MTVPRLMHTIRILYNFYYAQLIISYGAVLGFLIQYSYEDPHDLFVSEWLKEEASLERNYGKYMAHGEAIGLFANILSVYYMTTLVMRDSLILVIAKEHKN